MYGGFVTSVISLSLLMNMPRKKILFAEQNAIVRKL